MALKLFFRELSSPLIAATEPRPTRAATNAYSIKSCPESSFASFLKKLFYVCHDFPFLFFVDLPACEFDANRRTISLRQSNGRPYGEGSGLCERRRLTLT